MTVFSRTCFAAVAGLLAADAARAQPTVGNPLNPATARSVAVPRLTAARRRVLYQPQAGTMIFQTDSTAGFYYYTGAAWVGMPALVKPAARVYRNALPGAPDAPNRVLTLAGRLSPGHADGPAASFFSPHGVAVDAAGTVFVADTHNHRIRTISPAGVVSVLAGSTKGYSEGTGAAAHFNAPTGLAVDSEGTVYVADTGNERIRKISPAGVVTTLAGGKQGFADGIGPAATFHSPYAVAVDVDGAVYVADAGNNRICRIAPDGAVVTLVGSLKGLNHPTGLAVDAAGAVYVADSGNNRICKVTADGNVSTWAGSTSGFADGPGEAARFNHPVSVAVDDAGTVYVGEQGNNRVRVISPAGMVSTVAGSGIATFADGTGPQASFSLPVGIALDASGTLYVADMGNNSIRKVVLR